MQTMPVTNVLRQFLLGATAGLAAVAFASSQGHAQFITPDAMLPLPAGTSFVETMFGLSHYYGFQFTNGRNVPDTSLDNYAGTLELAHYFDIAGQRFAVKLSQSAALTENWQVGGLDNSNASGMRKLGASDPFLSVDYWPLIDTANRMFVFTSLSVAPPIGSYDENRSINAGFGAWRGMAQIGAHKGYGANFSIDLAFDAGIYGDQPKLFGQSVSTDPTYRVQAWLNWDWGNGLRTSVGYAGVFGGDMTERYFTGFSYQRSSLLRSADVQRIRASVSYWWTPAIQTAMDLAHDVYAPGGYQLGIAAVGRVKFLF